MARIGPYFRKRIAPSGSQGSSLIRRTDAGWRLLGAAMVAAVGAAAGLIPLHFSRLDTPWGVAVALTAFVIASVGMLFMIHGAGLRSSEAGEAGDHAGPDRSALFAAASGFEGRTALATYLILRARRGGRHD